MLTHSRNSEMSCYLFLHQHLLEPYMGYGAQFLTQLFTKATHKQTNNKRGYF